MVTDLDTFIQESLLDIGHVLGVHRVYVFTHTGHHWKNAFSWIDSSLPPFEDLLEGSKLEDVLYQDGMVSTLEAGSPYIIESTNTFPSEEGKATLRGQSIEGLIMVPLFSHGKFTAFLGVDQCTQVEQWVQHTLSTVITLGHLVNNAINYFNSIYFLKKKEEETQELLDVLPLPMYISNPEKHEILCCNKIMCDYVGDQKPLHKKCYEVIFNFDSPCEFCKIDILPPPGQVHIWDLHSDHLQADFKVIDCFIAWEDVPKAKLVIALDIGDSLRLQREQVLERESSKAKSRFLANMSHELRTPLNGIIGMTNLAIQDNKDPKLDDYLDKIHFSSKKLLDIINNILDFSKLEAGKLELEYHPFSPKEVCENLAQSYQEQAKAKGITLRSFVDANVPPILLGDSLRFSQILQHFIKNALTFTEEGGVHFSLYTATSKKSTNKQLLRLIVQDSGIGMSEQEASHLFEFFTQADSSNTRRYGGTGLGLAIVNHLIALMGGEISVQSSVGKGTTFTCHIPFVLPQENTANDSEENFTEHGVTTSNSKQSNTALQKQDAHVSSASDQAPLPLLPEGLRVLLTEDNEINSLIAFEILSRLGCQVDCARDGLEALEYIEKNAYDIILMDVQMPRMNGLEAAERIRQDTRFDTVPIVALTAHILSEEIEKCYAAGMQSHVLKPISPEALQKALAQCTLKNFVFSR